MGLNNVTNTNVLASIMRNQLDCKVFKTVLWTKKACNNLLLLALGNTYLSSNFHEVFIDRIPNTRIRQWCEKIGMFSLLLLGCHQVLENTEDWWDTIRNRETHIPLCVVVRNILISLMFSRKTIEILLCCSKKTSDLVLHSILNLLLVTLLVHELISNCLSCTQNRLSLFFVNTFLRFNILEIDNFWDGITCLIDRSIKSISKLLIRVSTVSTEAFVVRDCNVVFNTNKAWEEVNRMLSTRDTFLRKIFFLVIVHDFKKRVNVKISYS